MWLWWLLIGCTTAMADSSAPPTPSKVETVLVAELFRHRTTGFRLVQPLELPRVRFLQYPDLMTQGQGMNRIAALIEKKGSSGQRPLNDKDLAKLVATAGGKPETFFLGHDYRARDLARFFTLARQDRLALNTAENQLFTLLMRHDFFTITENGTIQPKEEELVLITLPPSGNTPDKLSPDKWRDTLRHELSHGEFFTNPHYRAYCQQQWAELPPEIRQIYLEEFKFLGYDPTHEELMVNEWQAFLWEPTVGGFIAVRLYKIGERLANLRQRFLAGIDTAPQPITRLFEMKEFRELPRDDEAEGRRP